VFGGWATPVASGGWSIDWRKQEADQLSELPRNSLDAWWQRGKGMQFQKRSKLVEGVERHQVRVDLIGRTASRVMLERF
jgi:hypothetical protein